MNYEAMNYIANGIIIENLHTKKIVYMNHLAKKILQIPKEKSIVFIKELFHNETIFNTIHTHIKNTLHTEPMLEEIIYFQTPNNTLIEACVQCLWIDQEQALIGYIFKHIHEVVEQTYISFHEMIEYLPSSVIILSTEPELVILFANTEHYKILDMHKDNPDAMAFHNILYEEDRDWVLTEIYESLHKNVEVDIEFRMKTYNNTLKWVRLYGKANISNLGTKLFYANVKDLSFRREINDKLHLERVLFHKMAELTEEILFRVDLESNVLYFLGKPANRFKDKPTIHNFEEALLEMDLIYEEDIPVFHKMIAYFKEGIDEFIEIRHKTLSGEIEWYKIVYNFVNNSEGVPLLVSGKIININDQKILEEQARVDLLTNFYNKITTSSEINRFIQLHGTDYEHSLFIIDIDNFKAINDNLGHHFGDIVLKEVADDIRNCFRKDDILGRIGGDEFIVLMKYCKDETTILEKAETLRLALQKNYSGKDRTFSISASIGISRFPYDGMNYEELYQTADIGLYRTKANGKNGFTLYHSNFSEHTAQELSQINPHENNSVDAEIIANVLRLIHEDKHTLFSLQNVVEYLGTIYQVDRCYIFENLPEDDVYHNNYQWVKNVFPPNYQSVVSLNMHIVNQAFSLCDANGILYLDDVHKLENSELKQFLIEDSVTSLLLIQSVTEYGNAFFVMDDCFRKRQWSKEDIRTLFQCTRIIFTVLTHYHIIHQLSKELLK